MNTQHTGNTKMQPCPIGQRRRKTVARRAMGSVGMVGNCRAVRVEVTMA